MHTFFSKVLMLCALGLIVGCGGPQTFSGQRQRVKDPEQPEWVAKSSVADTRSAKAFVGISNRHAGLPQSREEAEINAYSTAMNYVGMVVERAIRQVGSQTSFSSDNRLGVAVVRDATIMLRGTGLLRGEIVKYHTEHWETSEVGDWYETYALFLVPRDVLKFAAQNMLATGMQGRTANELESLRRAQEILESMSFDE